MENSLNGGTTHSMTILVSVGVLVLIAIGLFACTATKKQMSGTVAEVQARELAFSQSMQDRDLEAFRTFISPEAIFFNGNESLKGQAKIVAEWAAFFEGPTAPFSWKPDVVELLESGNLALSSGPVLSPAGEEVGRFNSIWRLDPDGVWRVVFDKGS